VFKRVYLAYFRRILIISLYIAISSEKKSRPKKVTIGKPSNEIFEKQNEKSGKNEDYFFCET